MDRVQILLKGNLAATPLCLPYLPKQYLFAHFTSISLVWPEELFLQITQHSHFRRKKPFVSLHDTWISTISSPNL
eukprot:14651657-Ditylum_brightwellii.AAC.1